MLENDTEKEENMQGRRGVNSKVESLTPEKENQNQWYRFTIDDADTILTMFHENMKKSGHYINSGSLLDEDIETLKQSFSEAITIMVENHNVETSKHDIEGTRNTLYFDKESIESMSYRLAESCAMARGYESPGEFVLSAIYHEIEQTELPDEEEIDRMGLSIIKGRGEHYSPVMSSMEEMDEMARQAADIIDKNNRLPVDFNNLIDEYHSQIDESFKPDCEREFVYIDTESYSRQIGSLGRRQTANVIETKRVCSECPLRAHCLASSLAAPQNTRMSQKERTIPRKGGVSETATMTEYLMFGGFTPQERRIIFEKTCDILEKRDNQSQQ